MISRDRGGCGALAFFGPAYPDSIEYFNPGLKRPAVQGQPAKELSPEMLLSGLASKKTSEWEKIYHQSHYRTLFVDERRVVKVVPKPTGGDARQTASRGFGFGQWSTLVHRNYLLKLRDRAQLIILLIQAPLFALLVSAVFSKMSGLDMKTDFMFFEQQIGGLEFLMVVAAVWFGCNNVARDIVGEWTVYERERMVSLKLPSYVFSKFFVAGVLCLLQCLVLLGIVTLLCHLKGNFLESLSILYLASLVGAALGLCVSARSKTTEAAIAMLPLILLPVIALGGGILPIYKMNQPLQYVARAVPSSWAYEGALQIEAEGEPKMPSSCQDKSCDVAQSAFPDGQPSPQEEKQVRTPIATCFLVLGGMLVFWLSLALVFLRRRDVH
jgi:hypothetical protein